MVKTYRAVMLAGAVVVLGSTLTPALGEQQARKCTIVADDDALHASGRATAEGHFQHEEWAVDPGSQRAFGEAHAALGRTFGTNTKDDTSATLRAGLIGSVLDHRSRQMIVVVDPALVDEGALQAQMDGAAARGGKGRGFVRVVAGCASAERLAGAAKTLADRAWHQEADTVAMGYGLDAHTSTYQVTLDSSETDVADALKSELGDLVTIEYGNPERRGRLDDGEPHYGGAGIRASYEPSNTCTSGFTVRLSTGARGSLTAGHCYNNGANIYSGPQYYGLTAGESSYPAYDMIRINPNGETFDNKIHVDPCCPSVRTVTHRSNPGLHEYICVSGRLTRAVCGIEVVNTSYSLCDSDGCTHDTFMARKPGALVGQGGDSGAPSYTRPTTSTASIKGMEIGGTASDNFVGEKITHIEAHLSVTVATS